MERFIVATQNEGKIREIKAALFELNFDIVSLNQVGLEHLKVEETGCTFEQNAMIKAKTVFDLCKQNTMADDSGLEIDFLNGEPGVHSARFGDKNWTYQDKNKEILRRLKNVDMSERMARFVCVIAVILVSGQQFSVRGTCEGYISYEARGDNGFGYDPIFFVPQYNMTMAQMSTDMKNKISHRGNALALLLERLKALK